MTNALDRLIDRGAATGFVVFAADPDEAPRIQEAESALKRAQRQLEAASTPEDTLRCEQRRDEAEAALEKIHGELVTVRIDVAGIGPTNVEELVKAHPPTKPQIQAAVKASGGNPQARPQWNEDTFPKALLVEAITRIAYSDDEDGAVTSVTPEQMDRLWASSLTVADRSTLFLTALSLDQRGSSVEDLGKD